MEWGIKLKSNREDLFKKRFWTLVGKMIISFTIIAVFFILLKRIIELSDFQWLYDIDSVSYYRSIETFNKLYYNGTVYIVVATLAIIIFLILLYKEIKHMTSYINIISDSSEKLFDGSEEYIDLPPEMKELEVKLNHFRSESIKNKKSAEENEKKKDELIVYLAHDIKTPLTVVIGYLSLLDEIEDMPLEQRKKYIELALNKSYRLEELINELFDIARFNSEKIILEKEELTEAKLNELDKEYDPWIVIVEYNGMWDPALLMGTAKPRGWEIYQSITLIDATAFNLQWNNMRSIIAETVKYTDMVIFNRCKSGMDLGSYRRSMRALNNTLQIVFEDDKGEMMSIAEQLPYDVNADIIEVDDADYGIWYMDVSERPDVYVGKKVRFKGQVLKNKYFKDKNFVPGRKVMTCCAEDTQFIGYISFYNNIASLENRQWIMVTATIKNEFQMAYKKKGPVLYVEKVENAEPPVEEMVYF